ncbi:hypothetical protein [Streptomyces sp. SP18CS02]|uniref:hypothetical protein n=1 Tax=Streptomyces sp. SP18CS02 TaxID=3002531 RepID=UPI002E7951B9|nr:hypothetical protein [Streptomyces sp. SP18CS02]MEE1756278.1 hypothetical protein [Streptomyces sp. SP18CS02]
MRGEASDDGQVYQSQRDQRITQYTVNLHLARGADAEQYRGQADAIIKALMHTVGSLQERCEALEDKAERAREAGRAEALAGIQAELEASGLRLIQVQSRLEEARHDRERAEQLLIEARRAAEAYRREAEELRHRSETAPGPAVAPAALQGGPELADYDRVMATADAELADLRASLQRLTTEMVQDDSGVVPGEVISRSGGEQVPEEPGTGPAATPAAVAGPGREGAAGLLSTLAGLGVSVVPFLAVGVSIREMYGQDPAVFWMLLYTFCVPLAVFALTYFVKGVVLIVGGWDGKRRENEVLGWHAVNSVLAFAYALVLPDTLGGFVQATGMFLAELGPL